MDLLEQLTIHQNLIEQKHAQMWQTIFNNKNQKNYLMVI